MTNRVEVLTDIEFASPAGVPLKANLFIPQDAGAPVPVIIWVHGGGWRFGSRELAPDLSRFFAASGFAMAAVDYRLSHHAIFPAQIEDLKTAIRWVRSVAPCHGFDGDRIGLLGSSAGGHLAALAALTAADVYEPDEAPYREHASHVRAVVDGYGPTDFRQIDAHRPADDTRSEDPETLLLPAGITRSSDPASFESLLLGAPIGSCPDRARAANPITYVRPGAPPFLILHGASDTTVPVHQSELLYDALAAHDNDVTLCVIERLGHGFLHRTHLDEGPPRPMVERRHIPGHGESVQRVERPIFLLIEDFFRTSLG
jgi:acetyl esterase/lipase